jgi:hypothetical protein
MPLVAVICSFVVLLEDQALASGKACLEVELLTMGPGRAIVTRFGHSALRVTQACGGTDRVFNFGTFDVRVKRPTLEFLAGTLDFWLDASSWERFREQFRAEGRRLIAQRLELTPSQATRLVGRLEWLARPANRRYRYVLFGANCATRIRDELDAVLEGQLRRQLGRVKWKPFRHYARRATRDQQLVYLGLDVLLSRADRQHTLWEAGADPELLMVGLGRARIRDPANLDRPLVRSTRIVLPGPGFEPSSAVSPWVYVLALGFLLSLTSAGLAWRCPVHAWTCRVNGILILLWGIAGCGVGCGLVGLGLLSSQEAFTGNQNALLLPPTQGVLAYVGAQMLQNKRWPAWCGTYAWMHVAVLALYAGTRWLGLVEQGNAPLLAFTLPPALAAALASGRVGNARDA